MCIRDRCEALRVCGILLNAYLPTTAPKMMEQLGLDASALDLTKTTYGAQQTYTCLLYTSPRKLWVLFRMPPNAPVSMATAI